MKCRLVPSFVCIFTLFGCSVAPILKNSIYTPVFADGTVSSPSFIFSSDLLGPFEGDNDVTLNWSYYSQTDYKENVVDTLYVYCDSYSSQPIETINISQHPLRSYTKYSCKYIGTILNKYLTMNSGYRFVFEVYSSTREKVLCQCECKLKPKQSRNINPLNYRSEYYEISDYILGIKKYSDTEKFLFDEFADFIECDNHNRLLFNKQSFIYEGRKKFKCGGMRIKFIDKFNLFTGLNIDGDGYRYVDMDYGVENKRVSLSIPNLYVDPLTLVVNLNGVGSKSDYLYVPKGRAKDIEDYEFILEGYNLGENLTSFSHYMQPLVSEYYIGNGEEADYSITGGVKK